MEPKISVIIPVYNVGKYIKRCIESVIGQTYKNLEIIIVNDGSTDDSGNICKLYEGIDTRIHYYEKANGGLSDARNYGLKQVTGDYISFIDSDDCLSPVFFEVLIRKSDEYNADIVTSDILYFHNDNELEKYSKIKNSRNKEKILHDRQIILQYLYPEDDFTIYHGLCMKIYRKELFDNLWFEVGKVHEDLYITYQLLYRSKCLVIVKEPLYYYFQNNMNSISNNYTAKNYVDECNGFLQIINFLSSKSYAGELYNFGCRSLLYASIKAAGFINDPDIQHTKEHVNQWVKSHVFKAKGFPFYKKMAIYCMIDHIGLYKWLRKRIKGV